MQSNSKLRQKFICMLWYSKCDLALRGFFMTGIVQRVQNVSESIYQGHVCESFLCSTTILITSWRMIAWMRPTWGTCHEVGWISLLCGSPPVLFLYTGSIQLIKNIKNVYTIIIKMSLFGVILLFCIWQGFLWYSAFVTGMAAAPPSTSTSNCLIFMIFLNFIFSASFILKGYTNYNVTVTSLRIHQQT